MNTQPDTTTTEGKIAVMQAALAGKKIECNRTLAGHLADWQPTTQPAWDWGRYDYRIAPEPERPKYRPWTQNEIPFWVVLKHKNSSWIGLITSSDKAAVVLGSDQKCTSFQCLLDNYTLLDGTPCGVLEEAQ